VERVLRRHQRFLASGQAVGDHRRPLLPDVSFGVCNVAFVVGLIVGGEVDAQRHPVVLPFGATIEIVHACDQRQA
jgi:hypothetical protein